MIRLLDVCSINGMRYLFPRLSGTRTSYIHANNKEAADATMMMIYGCVAERGRISI